MNKKIRQLATSTSAIALAVCGLNVATAHADGLATGDTSGLKIAITDGFSGNSWHATAIEALTATGDGAVADGIIADYKILIANNDPNEQSAQIQNLTLEGYDAIVIDAASETASNGAIKEACDAGIIVVTYDSIASEPCATKVTFDFHSYGSIQTQFVSDLLGGTGNILEIRGAAGSAADATISSGVNDTLAANASLSKVGEVYGNWTEAIAQKEVASILPSLPEVNAVLTQGGDGYGAYQAFAAAGREIPIIVMGNRQDELALWKELKEERGYNTISLSAAPQISAIAFWTAQQILAGKDVPASVEVPLLQVNEETLDDWLAVTKEGQVASPVYSAEWVGSLIDAVAAGKSGAELPAAPVPAAE
jgi:ribose transport system substrate-binding protein